MSYIGIGVEKFEVVVTVGDGRKEQSTSLSPGQARRVAIKILEAIGEAETRAEDRDARDEYLDGYYGHGNINGRKEIRDV